MSPNEFTGWIWDSYVTVCDLQGTGALNEKRGIRLLTANYWVECRILFN